MKSKALVQLVLLCCLFLPFSIALAQDSPADQAAAQKAWVEYMTPGTAHKMLAESNGEWKFKMSMWMKPDAEPMVSEGTVSYEMIIGGRYQKAIYKGSFMGMPFEGWSMTGVDNMTHEITSIWYDNLGTGTSISKGTYDKATNTVTLRGSSLDPMTGKDAPFKQTVQFLSKDKQLMKYYMVNGDKEFKTMEVESWR